jgi:subtilisin family serine protease
VAVIPMKRRTVLLAGLALAGTWVAAGEGSTPTDSWVAKVHPRVLAEASTRGSAELLVILAEQAALPTSSPAATKVERGRAVVERLTTVASRSQAPIRAWLDERGVPYRSFWIANMLWVRADATTIAGLASRADVRRIDANPRVSLSLPPAETAGAAPAAIEWGIAQTRADQVWALGYDGSGTVIGGQDTGYAWEHPALIASYRGWDGATADHDYNWHDAIHAGGGTCGAEASAPCDDHSHGTHTMGTMVGDDGGENQIGMAPGARWIGCRNMDQGNGTPASYSECFQFFVAPTDVAGNDPDPARAPHVINNSWICTPSEGCSFDTLQTVVDNTRAAGIVVVASAGNSGSDCGTIDAPPAVYDAALTIGATSSSDQIASFSSRGPVTIDGSERPKPDLSAPGVNVRSSVPGGGYASFSGTSMAGPHVAGAVALLLDARPDLIGKVEVVEELLRRSALPRTSTQNCGDMPGPEVPNAVYGHGRLDVLEALVGDADGDGLANLDDCSPLDGNVTGPPGAAVGLTLWKSALSTTVLTWSPPASGGVLRYDVLRSNAPDDFTDPTCLVAGSATTTAADDEAPASLFHYLVRSRNACGASVGSASDGTPREAGPCAESP